MTSRDLLYGFCLGPVGLGGVASCMHAAQTGTGTGTGTGPHASEGPIRKVWEETGKACA